MHYGQINKCSVTDGPGIRVSLYVSGCRNHCPGCHNPQTWDFNFGKEYTNDTVTKILNYLDHDYVRGLSIAGGEPFEEENQKYIYELLKIVKEKYPEKDIWVWTGYELDELKTIKHTEYTDGILSNINTIITGRFVLALRDISSNNLWRGSTNQKIINLN